MKTEKITQKQLQKLREQLFMQSLGQQFIGPDGYIHSLIGLPYMFDGIHCEFKEEGKSATLAQAIHLCTLLKKPLGRISEEHKLELERLCGMKNSRQTLQMILFDLHNKTSIVGPNVHWVQIITDQCREWGYALPYKNWSVKELEEFGIYKLID